MYKLLTPLAIMSIVLLNLNVKAQSNNDASHTPSEVGKTTMPPGHYSVVEQNTGKKYSLMVTKSGTMVLSHTPTIATNTHPTEATHPTTTTTTTAPATTAAAAPNATPANNNGLQGMAKTRIQKEVNRFIQKQGTKQLNNLIK